MTGQADDMAAALQAAQDRIVADGAHAEQLSSDLAAANAKLKDLETSIKKAAASAVTRTVTVVYRERLGGSSGATIASRRRRGGGDD